MVNFSYGSLATPVEASFHALLQAHNNQKAEYYWDMLNVVVNALVISNDLNPKDDIVYMNMT
jgi:hypothetical protein